MIENRKHYFTLLNKSFGRVQGTLLQKGSLVAEGHDKRLRKYIYLAGVISLIIYLVWFFLVSHRVLIFSEDGVKAVRSMERAVLVMRRHCDKEGIKIDKIVDPGRTGLIGPAYSGIVTTKGNLEAKQAAVNPAMAGLIVHLLKQAGVKRGDTIALGSSGSFPGLMIAGLAAAEVMGLRPVVIFSLGASSYGASDLGFNLLDMFLLLKKSGVFSVEAAAVSLGGEGDIGGGFGPGMKERLIEQIRRSKIQFIYEPDLRENVLARMAFYRKHAVGGRIAAFINSGGGEANIGTSSLVLKVKPGLNRMLPLPPERERGVIFEMAHSHVPCIHLLYIKGLIQEYGLPLLKFR